MPTISYYHVNHGIGVPEWVMIAMTAFLVGFLIYAILRR